MVANVTKIPQKMKKINWFSTEKILENEKKRFIIIKKKCFHLESFASLSGKV